MAEVRDISMDQGTSFNPTFVVRNKDKSPFNFTGYTARLQVRSSYDSDEVLVSATTENGKLTVTSNGRIILNLVPADTSALTLTGEELAAVYDLEVQSGAGIVTRAVQGAFNISREVTR